MKNGFLITLLALAVVALNLGSGSAVKAESLEVVYKGKPFTLPFGVNKMTIREPTAFYYGKQIFRPTKESRMVAVYSTKGPLVIANFNGNRTVGLYSGDPKKPYDPKKASFNYFGLGHSISSDKEQIIKTKVFVEGAGDTEYPYLSARKAVIRTKLSHNVYWHDLATNNLVPYSETTEYQNETKSDLAQYFGDDERLEGIPDDFDDTTKPKGFDFSNFKLENIPEMLLSIFIPTEKGGFKRVFNKFIDKLTLDDDELFDDGNGGVNIHRGKELQFYMHHDNYNGIGIFDTVGSLLSWLYRFILLAYLYKKKGQLFS